MKNPKETKKETAQTPKPGTKPAGQTSPKPGQPGTTRPETPKR